MSTVSWLSCWKELRCLNLDFSHGLTQANVLSTSMRQQALQLSPYVQMPPDSSHDPVTGNRADVAPPTSTSPAHPLHRWRSAPPSPATLPETKLQKLLLPAPAQSPERLSPTTEAATQHRGLAPHSHTSSPNSTTTTALPYPTPHSQGKKEPASLNTKLPLSGPIYHRNSRKSRAPKTSSFAN